MKRNLRYLRTLATIASLALFVYVLRRTSAATILTSARAARMGLCLPDPAVRTARHALRTLAWHRCDRPGWASARSARPLRTATDGRGAERPDSGRTAARRDRQGLGGFRSMPGASSVSSVVIENLIYGLGGGLVPA